MIFLIECRKTYRKKKMCVFLFFIIGKNRPKSLTQLLTMGDLNVRITKSKAQSQHFIRNLLQDVEAMEYMIEHNWFDTGITRIGAEQELCIVDSMLKPSHNNLEVLEQVNHPDIVTELAKFNLELNLDPSELTGDCFSKLEQEILDKLSHLNKVVHEMNIDTVLTGILPTIRKSDLAQENVTPLERYQLLIKILNKLKGSQVELNLGGTDELNVKHDSALLEACNTSFQVHLQVSPEEFVDQYNFAQIIAAPVMAVAANSPILFGKRLWHETRIALFQQALDTRKRLEHLRDRSARVIFGNDWLKHSIVELYREDIARYKVILNADIDQDSMEMIKQGITPKLRALNIHNGTVYRWNRPCYGISPNGKPHLRIENRILPAGPSVLDEVANAAFWIGLMKGFDDDVKEIVERFDFHDAKNNFFAACRYGINSYFHWLDGKKIDAVELIKEKLIPLAKKGLEKHNVDQKDIERYIGVIEQRVAKRVTGSTWTLDSFNQLIKHGGREEAATAITAKMIHYQKKNMPVHDWELATLNDIKHWSPHSLKVEEFMTTDLFTVHPDDILELVADILDWRKIRHLPVEDKKGKLVGVISSRLLLKHFRKDKNNVAKTVKDVMVKDVISISPYDSIIDAIKIMEEKGVGCLPVLKKNKLVGIVTEVDFLNLTNRLLKRLSETS